MPTKIALVFDGWSINLTHYIAVFASFPFSYAHGVSTRLLTLSPMGGESKLDACEDYQFVGYILDLYGLSWDNVVCLIGDNCNTNRSIANLSNLPLIGCAWHRFQLTLWDIINTEAELIEKVHKVMVKLISLLLSPKLRRYTPLRPKSSNRTRWSSTYAMLKRHVTISVFFPLLNSDEIAKISLSLSENRRLEMLLKKLDPLESFTKALHEDSTNVKDTRALFDAVIGMFPDTADRLSSCSSIVHSRIFEDSIVKLQRRNAAALSI